MGSIIRFESQKKRLDNPQNFDRSNFTRSVTKSGYWVVEPRQSTWDAASRGDSFSRDAISTFQHRFHIGVYLPRKPVN